VSKVSTQTTAEREAAAKASYSARAERWVGLASVLLAGGADPFTPVQAAAQGLAAQMMAGLRSMVGSSSSTTTAFAHMILVEPKDHR
jgi:hypothetical protein